jgi:hypothetical protein
MRITVTNLQHVTHINLTQWVSFNKTIMKDLIVCKSLARLGVHMKLNASRGIDASL